MNEAMRADASPSAAPDHRSDLLKQYGCGPIRFSGTKTRFTSGICSLTMSSIRRRPGRANGSRRRPGRSGMCCRNVGCRPKRTYDRENPKRIYYLSMEFLIGRSLSQQHHESAARSVRQAAVQQRNLDWLGCWSRSPMPASETAGSAGWPLVSSTRWRRCNFRRWATGCATNTACSSRSIQDGWQREQPDNWLRRPDPWEVRSAARDRGNQAQLLVRDARRAACAPSPARPSTCRRPVRPAGGRLRRQDHQYVAAVGSCGTRLFRFSGIQQRRFRRRAGRDAWRPNP